MILPIYTYGQPVLRQEAEEIDKDYPELEKLIKDMYETLSIPISRSMTRASLMCLKKVASVCPAFTKK